MLRICHVLPSLQYHGAASQVKLLTELLPRDEFELHVVGLKGGPMIFPGAKATTIGQSWSVDPGAFMRLRSLLRKLQPNIVHTWQFAANTYGRAAARSAGVRHMIASERAVDDWKFWRENFLDRFYAQRSNRIIVNSQTVKAFYESKGISAEKISVIPGGVAIIDDELAKTKPANGGKYYVGAACRLTPDRRVKDLIWAGDLLKCIRDDVHLVLFGEGPHRWRLEKYARQTSMVDRVQFLGATDTLQNWLPRLHVAWFGAGHVGCSSWLLEAMAAGLPVVAPDTPCNREVVKNGETGYLIPLGDRASLARWTNVLLNDADLRQRLGAAGKKRVRDFFSAREMARQHANVYRQIAEET